MPWTSKDGPGRAGVVGSLVVTLYGTVLSPAALADDPAAERPPAGADAVATEELMRFVLDCEGDAQSTPPPRAADREACSMAYEALKARLGGWEAYHRWWQGARRGGDRTA